MTGSGTIGDPYIIENVTDLQNVESDLTAYYELGSDIDASETSGWNGGLGFIPIGIAADFTGHFDGKGYSIDSLYENDTSGTYGMGLFQINAGTIQNVRLNSCEITGVSAGSIAYKNTGTITKCAPTGAIVATGFTAGFVQWNLGSINNCYTRCSVTGGGFAGGFVQWNDTGGVIDDCYSTGAVSGATFMAGFCQSNGATITNCFWDTETSGQAASDGGTGKTTAEMTTKATFTAAGWDFTTVWSISSIYNDGYPNLDGVGEGVKPNFAHYFVLVDWDDDNDFSDAESDITADVIDADVQRGKDRELGRAVAASMVLEVKNSSYKYSPPNTSSVLNTGGNSLRGGHRVIAGLSFPYDSFTDTDGVALASHTPDVPYDSASLWSEEAGTWLIDANKVKETGGVGGQAVMETAEPDVHIAVLFTKGANNDGIIVFRFTDTSNFLEVRTTATDIAVWKTEGGVLSQVATVAYAWAAAETKTVKVILHGNYIYVLVDMVLKLSTSSSFNATATKHGIGGQNIGANARYAKWGCSYNLFYGTVDRIVPNPGIEQRTAYIECSDDFKTLAQLKLRRRAYPIGGFADGTDGFIEEILKNNASNASQLGFILDAGQTIQGFTKAWWDVFALDQCHKIEAEENGFFYQDPDGLWRFENRGHRAAAPHDSARCIIYAVRGTNGIFMTDMKWRSGMEDVINRVTVNYKLSVKQLIEETTEDIRDLWVCEEANVFGGGVASSTLSIPALSSKVIYFESAEYDAITALVAPSSTVSYELLEGVIASKAFKLGETATGSVSGTTGTVIEEGGGYILVKLTVPGTGFGAGDTVAGGTSGASMNGGLTITQFNDYAANAVADGSGADMTANLTVTLAAVDASDEFNYGKGGKLTLANGHATDTLYVTWLRVRGKGYKLKDAVAAYVVDTVSEGLYGERSHVVDSELFTTYDEAKALADDIEDKEDAPRAKIDVVMINGTKESLMQLLARRLSDRVTVNWSSFGVNEDFYVNSLRHRIYDGGAGVECTISLEEVS